MNIRLYIHSNIINQGFIVPRNLESKCSVGFRTIPGTTLYIPENYFYEDESLKFITFQSGDFSFDISIPEIDGEENKIIGLPREIPIPGTLSELCYQLNINFPGEEWHIDIESCLGVSELGFYCPLIENFIKADRHNSYLECKRVPLRHAEDFEVYFKEPYRHLLKGKYFAMASFNNVFNRHIISITKKHNKELYDALLNNPKKVLSDKMLDYTDNLGRKSYVKPITFNREDRGWNFTDINSKFPEVQGSYLSANEVYMALFVPNNTITGNYYFKEIFSKSEEPNCKIVYNPSNACDSGIANFSKKSYIKHIDDNFRNYKKKFINYIIDEGHPEEEVRKINDFLNKVCSYDVIVIPFENICEVNANLYNYLEGKIWYLYQGIKENSHLFTT